MREGESKKNGIKNGITIKQKMKLRVRSSETAPRNKFSKQQKVKEREKKIYIPKYHRNEEQIKNESLTE